jgi:hypothetical protein
VLAALVRRALDLRREDTTVALRHVVAGYRRCRPSRGAALDSGASLARQAYRRVSDHLPIDLAVRMALKPLRLSPLLQRVVARPLQVLGAGIVSP